MRRNPPPQLGHPLTRCWHGCIGQGKTLGQTGDLGLPLWAPGGPQARDMKWCGEQEQGWRGAVAGYRQLCGDTWGAAPTALLSGSRGLQPFLIPGTTSDVALISPVSSAAFHPAQAGGSSAGSSLSPCPCSEQQNDGNRMAQQRSQTILIPPGWGPWPCSSFRLLYAVFWALHTQVNRGI